MVQRRYFLFCLIFAFSQLSYGYEFNNNSSYDININGDDFSAKVWISQLFLEGQKNFDMDANVSVACKRDFEFYKLNLRNSTVWAIRSKYCDNTPDTN